MAGGRLQRIKDPDTGAVVGYVLDGVQYSVKDFRTRLQEMVTNGDADGEAIIGRVNDFRSLRGQVAKWKSSSKEPGDIKSIDAATADLKVALDTKLDADPEKRQAWRSRLQALQAKRDEIMRANPNRTMIERSTAGAPAREPTTGALSPAQGLPPQAKPAAQTPPVAAAVAAAGGAVAGQAAAPPKRDPKIQAALKKVLGRDATDEEYDDFAKFHGQ